MKKAITAFSVLVAAFAMAQSTEKATIDQILANIEKFDEAIVTTTGKVADFKAKTSKAGKKYFTFKLKDGKGEVNVYGRGELESELKKNDKVEVKGKFRALKKMKDFEVKNEIDVSGKGDAKPSVKKL